MKADILSLCAALIFGMGLFWSCGQEPMRALREFPVEERLETEEAVESDRESDCPSVSETARLCPGWRIHAPEEPESYSALSEDD